jgi:hypothetical protein
MVSYDGMSLTYKANYYNHRLFVVISFGFPGTETMLAFQEFSRSYGHWYSNCWTCFLFFNLVLVRPTLSYFLCLWYIVFKQQRQGLCFQWTNTLWAILKAFLESIAWSNGLMSRLDVLVGCEDFSSQSLFKGQGDQSHLDSQKSRIQMFQ